MAVSTKRGVLFVGVLILRTLLLWGLDFWKLPYKHLDGALNMILI